MIRFNKYPHPVNFSFADDFQDGTATIDGHALEMRIGAAGPDVYHVAVYDHRWRPDDFRSLAIAPLPGDSDAGKSLTRIEIGASASMRLCSSDDRTFLDAEPGGWLGVCDGDWLFRFRRLPDMQFYGLGEKQAPFERSGRSYWFWNTDVWADHSIEIAATGDYDPDYISVPYLIIKRHNTYLGLLVDTVFPAWISLAASSTVGGAFEQAGERDPDIVLGARGGRPSLYLLFGPSLAGLSRKLQALVGPTPLPPVWSLGYHQSRWGYRGAADLEELADRFERHRFPANGLWLDIDYMEGYRVFAIDSRSLPRPSATVAEMKNRGFRVVPILDPGIKREPGYEVYDSGKEEDVFCRNPAGGEFAGMAWPALTVFPDFSLPDVRRWWAGWARRLFDFGFEGAWLDMNDPSTGSIDCRDMRFDRGRLPHEAVHNRYALLMAKATREALLAAHPGRRSFLLSRSGCTGSQKYCAHWTGDNFSSHPHLRRSIGKCLNLAMSGIPFNGADVGGFGGDCSEPLLIDWFKAAFLMPFFRNHTMKGSRPQEPWAYSHRALDVIRRFVRLRYTLMPYLYNLFIDQEESGEAILRPLFHDFDDDPSLPLGEVDDQFMVGPAILQAPFVRENARQRKVLLPAAVWLRADRGGWVQGGRYLRERKQPDSTPLFLRDGSLIPFQPGERITNQTDLNQIGLMCCLSTGFKESAHLRYRSDDGISLAYREGKRTCLEISARVDGRNLELSVDTVSDGFGRVEITPFTFTRFRALHIEREGRRERLKPTGEAVRLAGKPFRWYRWGR
ncbi:MAG: glycoside hydrolase family 31 protein [Desulfobacterales bacterium]